MLTFVFGYDLLISNQNNPPGIGAQRDMAACILGRNAVTIAAILNKASGTHAHRLFYISVKTNPDRAQLCLLHRKYSINRLILLVRVRADAQFIAAKR